MGARGVKGEGQVPSGESMANTAEHNEESMNLKNTRAGTSTGTALTTVVINMHKFVLSMCEYHY